MTKIERELERLQASIVAIYSGLKVEVVKILEADLANPRPTAVMRSINAAIDRTRARARAWMDEAIPGPLQMKSRELAVKFNVLGFRPPGKRTALIKAQGKLYERLSDYLEKAHTRIRDSASRFVMLSQRMKRTAAKFQGFAIENVEGAYAKFEEFADEAAREMWSRVRLQKAMKDFLMGEIEGDNFITVNGRNYGIVDYTEMVARTELAEAQTELTLAESKEYGADLMEFSASANACDDCLEYGKEGNNIYSISGSHPTYPELTDEIPPVHPNCLLPGTKYISPGGIIAGHRALYCGQVIEFSFANGSNISVTPNHMFLGPFGFVPAEFLCESDDIFYCPDFEGIISCYPNNNERPIVIEDIFRSLLESSGMSICSMPTTPKYLHGDGRFCDGNIDIIYPDSLLRNTNKSFVFKKYLSQSFDSRNSGIINSRFGFIGDGDFISMFKRLAFAADSIMGGLRMPSLFFFGQTIRGNLTTGAQTSNWNISFNKPTMNRSAINIKALRQIVFEKSRLIQTTKIIDVRKFEYSGHVYDFQSPTSLYLSNSILSSNCACALNPTSEEAIEFR